MKKYLFCFFVAMMLFCVIASGGCGGSSSSSGSPNNQTEGDFNSLSGGNTVSNGSGTATGPDGNFELRLNAERTAAEGGVSFSNIQNAEVVQVTEDTVNVTMDYKIYWDMYQNGSYVRTEQMSGPLADRGTYSFRRTNSRTWQLVSDRSTRSMTMNFTSNSSARVEETRDDWQVGSNTYQCQVSYTIANQNSPTTYDLSILEGSWIASKGTATMIGVDADSNFSLTMRTDGGMYIFSNVQANGDTATVGVEGDTHWTINSSNGADFRASDGTLDLNGNSLNVHYGDEEASFRQDNGNVWKWTHSYDDADESRTMTIVSPTTVEIKEELIFIWRNSDGTHQRKDRWTATYTLTKQSAIDFSSIEGTWTVSSYQSGTIREIAGPTENPTTSRVRMDTDAAISFNNVTVNGNTATVGEMQVLTRWEWEDIYGTQRHTTNMHPSSAPFRKVSDNVWRWTKTDGSYPDETITIILVSPTTAVVKQELNPKTDVFVYRLVTSFTITKQNSNPSTTYDLSVLDGMWTASEGTASLSGYSRELGRNRDSAETFTMRANGGSFAFGDIHISDDNNVILSVSSLTNWTDNSSNNQSNTYGLTLQLQRESGNVWKWVRSYRYLRDGEREHFRIASVTLTITSPTTAEITEEIDHNGDDGETERWSATYKLTKRNSTTPSLNGTWRISSGTIDFRNGTTANYSEGSSSPETFMLALHETPDSDAYVLNVVGMNIYRHEGCNAVIATFGNSSSVKVVWGTSDSWDDFVNENQEQTSLYTLAGSTYSANFDSTRTVIAYVSSATFQLTDSSTIKYTQEGGNSGLSDLAARVDAELTLKRVE